MKINILIFISLLTFSCGKKKSVTTSKISLISGLSAISAQFPGGVVLFARNLDTKSLLVKTLTANDEEIQFDNGKYEFLIMGWSGAQHMTGTASCDGKDDISLEGKDIALNFNLDSSDCDTLATKPGALFFHSNVMGGNVPAISGDYSVRLSLPSYNGEPSTKFEELPSGIIGSTCLAKDSVNDDLNLDSSSSFPAIDVPIIAHVFDGSLTCAGAPTRMYVLPTGLDEDGFPYTVNSVNVPLDDLIFTVNVTSTDTMTLPLPIGFSYNLNVDWGDGNTSTVTAYNSPGISNMYTSSGEFVVRVSGLAEAFTCNSSASCDFITHVLNFGDLGYKDLSTGFKGASNLISFSGGKTNSVIDISSLFHEATSLRAMDLSKFNTSSVTDMSNVFRNMSSLVYLDLTPLDTSSASDMRYMFSGMSSLTSLDLTPLNTSSVTNMGNIFSGMNSLISLDLSPLDTSSVSSMVSMFKDMSSLTALDLTPLDTSSLTDTHFMFYGMSSLTSLDLTPLNTSSVTDMSSMFYGMSSLTSLDITSLDTSSVTTMNNMFSGMSSLASLDLTPLDTGNVTSMYYMFKNMSSLTALDLTPLDTSSVTSMSGMFSGMSSLTSLDLTPLDTSSVIDMGSMFQSTTNLTSINLSSTDTSSVTNMDYMFSNASALTSLNVSSFSTSNVSTMYSMFFGTSSLLTLDSTGWDLAHNPGAVDILLNTNGSLVITCDQPGSTFFGETCI